MAQFQAGIEFTADNKKVLAKLREIDRAAKAIRVDLDFRVLNATRALRTAEQVKKAASDIAGAFRTTTKPGKGEIADQLGVAKTTADKLIQSLRLLRSEYLKLPGTGAVQPGFSKSPAGVESQVAAFKTLAANTESTTAAFAGYVQAAEAASAVSFGNQLREIEALRQQYTQLRTITAQAARNKSEIGTPISAGSQLDALGTLLNEAGNTSATLAGLDLIEDKLRAILRVVDESAGGYATTKRIQEALVQVEERRKTLNESIARAAKEVRPQAVQQFPEMQAYNREISQALKPSTTGTREQQRQNAEVNNLINAQAQAVEEYFQARKQVSEQIKSLEERSVEEQFRTTSRLVDIETDRKVKAIEEVGARSLKVQEELNNRALRDFDQRLEKQVKAQQEADRKVEENRKKLRRDRETRVREGRQRQQRFREDLALGAGFPLLFGGGAGAVGGGLLGSLLGGGKGGFGLQILFSALGTGIDEFARKASDLSVALDTTGDATQQLETFIGRLDTKVKTRIKNLASSGQAAAAADASFKELADTIGKANAEALTQAGRDAEALGKGLQILATEISSFLIDLGQDILLLDAFRTPGGQTPQQTQTAIRRTEDLSSNLEVSKLLTAEAKARAQLLPDSIAKAERAVVLEENNLAIQKVRREQMDGLITAKDAELKKDKIIEDSNRRILSIELQRVEANAELAREKIRAANAAAQEEARVAQVLANQVREQLNAEFALERVRATTFAQQVQTEIKLAEFQRGKLAALALEIQYLEETKEAARSLLALENTKLASQLQGLVPEEEINRILAERTQLLEDNLRLREEELKRAVALAQLEESLVVPRAMDALQSGSNQARTNIFERRVEARGGASQKALEDAREILEIQEDLAELYGQASLNDAIREQNRLKEIEHTRFLEETMQDLVNTIGTELANAMQTALVDTIAAAITGAEDLNEKLQQTAASLLSTIGQAFVKAGISGLAGNDGTGFFSILNGTFGRANGGPVSANRPYIVGEREPELFVPNTSGTIYNQDQIRSMSTNYGPGNETTATAMAPMNSTINYNGPMLNFNGDEYIPRSEAQSLVQAGAKQGEARTLNALRNQRSTRSRIGI